MFPILGLSMCACKFANEGNACPSIPSCEWVGREKKWLGKGARLARKQTLFAIELLPPKKQSPKSAG